jgi:hypothetical protein
MGTPEARRRAAAAYEKRLQVSGARKITFRADAKTAATLARLIETHGTLQAAIKYAIENAAD